MGEFPPRKPPSNDLVLILSCDVNSVVVLPQPKIGENSVLTEPNIWGPNWALNVSNCKRVELGLGKCCYLLFMLLEQTIKKEISSIKRSLRICHCRAPSQNEIAKLFFSGHKREPQHHDTLFLSPWRHSNLHVSLSQNAFANSLMITVKPLCSEHH